MVASILSDLNELAKILDKPTPELVVVVGSGVAIDATGRAQASWLGLLKHGIQHLVAHRFQPAWGEGLKASLDAAFHRSPFDLEAALEHAELIERALTTPDADGFAEWLRAAFVDFKARPGVDDPTTLEALCDLQQAGALLLTTNYDSLLTDATNLPPVTWEEHDDFHRVMTRQKSGILHIHGHWRRPSSIVLGRTSYNRVVNDHRTQELFRSLWLNWHWLYVGCGNGLDDPNFGRLLMWSRNWGASGLSDIFLAQQDKAVEIASRADRPQNLLSFGYRSHAQLPGILKSLTPATRSWPFLQVDDSLPQFRSPGSEKTVPVPSHKEYLEGRVPILDADAVVAARLEKYHWAFVLDVASTGKTTLALRVATASEQQKHPSFYLDLAKEIPDDADPVSVLRRLTKPSWLLILDNANREPELARQLWDAWNASSRGSRLLMIATRVQQPVIVNPAQDLGFFVQHPTNPAIELRPTMRDLGRILQHLYRQVAGPRAAPLPLPPTGVLQHWHKTYGSALSFFCPAVMSSIARFTEGDWTLTPSAAAEWVRTEWLSPLDRRNRENLLCLAAFGSQDLELDIQNEALPHPGRTDQLWRLVSKNSYGQFGQYQRLSLREPGWGTLILGATPGIVARDELLYEAASRHPMTAVVLNSRLWQRSDRIRCKKLWEHLETNSKNWIPRIFDLPLGYFPRLLIPAHRFATTTLETAIWSEIERDRARLIRHMLEAHLGVISMFLDLHLQRQSDTSRLWKALEKAPEKLAARAWDTPLDQLGSFLDKAQLYPVITKAVWTALEEDPKKLAARAWNTPLGNVGSFLDKAQSYPAITKAIWEALQEDPKKVAARAWNTPLGDVGSFLDKAQSYPAITKAIWEALEEDPKKLAARAWDTPLDQLGSFLDKAQLYPVITKAVWTALEEDPKKLAARAWNTPLGNVGSFLDKAQSYPAITKAIWEALQEDPKKVAARAWDTPLDQLGSFLEKAQSHSAIADALCTALETEPQRLSSLIRQAPMNRVAALFRRVPDSVVKAAVTDIMPTDWDSLPLSQPLTGGAWVAARCGEIGRDDLRDGIITTLLRRASERDFPPLGMVFANVAWILSNAPDNSRSLVAMFLDNLCRKQWLDSQFRNSPCGSLATGLRMLAFHQTRDVLKRFHSSGLGIRLRKEWAAFARHKPDDKCLTVQMFGSATLCGWVASRQWFENVSMQEMAELPVSVLPHQQDAVEVEPFQYQLWLGLRAVASVTNRVIPVGAACISATLALWLNNLSSTSPAPHGTEHRLNQSMVKWFEKCSSDTRGFLLPERESLGDLAGHSAGRFGPASS
jgi:hypothetical protein